MPQAVVGAFFGFMSPTCPAGGQFDASTPDDMHVEGGDCFDDLDEEVSDEQLAKRRRLAEARADGGHGDGDVAALLLRCKSVADEAEKGQVPDIIADDTGVVDDIKAAQKLADEKFPDWPKRLKDVAVAATCIYDIRATEFSVIEQVIMLYLSEGTDRIRCHDGEAHVYKNGAHVSFDGLVGQGTLKRLRSFVKLLEGVFKSLPKGENFPADKKVA